MMYHKIDNPLLADKRNLLLHADNMKMLSKFIRYSNLLYSNCISAELHRTAFPHITDYFG